MAALLTRPERPVLVLRYGKDFKGYGDPYEGCGVSEIIDHETALLGPIAGPMNQQRRDDILDAHRMLNFERVLSLRPSGLWVYDITEYPYRRQRA
jgi:hypothetical protein